MKATQRLIDSVWTLEYNVLNNGKIFVINYSREDEEGYKQEKSLPRINPKENTNRVLEGVYIQPYEPFLYWAKKENSVYYEVENPKHIFSYKNEKL